MTGRLVVLFALFSLFASDVSAWSANAHRRIAADAEKRLHASVLRKIAELIGPGISLADLSTCADEIREVARNPNATPLAQRCLLSDEEVKQSYRKTSAWHFVNLPIPGTTNEADLRKACAREGSCIVSEIDRFTAELKNTSLPKKRRAVALMFLTHLIGDIHQPLHAVDRAGDMGGNTVHVRLGKSTTRLHGLWDSVLAEDAGMPSGRVNGRNTAPASWAFESRDAARRAVYKDVPVRETSAQSPIVLPAAYKERAQAVIRQRMHAASVRLAAVLAQALGN